MAQRILVVEDSPTQAERVRLLLEEARYRVDLAVNGREGLERVQSAPPDLIISDVVMPEMDGYAFCQAVKSAEPTKRIPFVLLTSQNAPEDIIKGLERGADNFITKPFEEDYLLERIQRIFEHLELRKQGSLDTEVTLSVAGRQITVNADKQQIIELLFSTFDELGRANAVLLERERDLEAANQQLQEASRHKSEFLANMSHELRTPLNSVIGFSELLLEQTTGPLNEKQTRFLTNIQSSGKHLLQLISDILDLSKVEAGKVVLQVEPLPVATTLEDVLVIARGLAHKKRQTVEAQIDPGLPPLQADPVRFKQILFNLLSNAIKFTTDGGSVTVTARRGSKVEGRGPSGDTRQELKPYTSYPAEFVEIAVADTGIGIKAEDLPRLFQEFVQLEAAAIKRYEGTGLGLALTRRLVELHGGRIWAESPGEGRGSTFTMVLPFAGPREVPDASTGAPT